MKTFTFTNGEADTNRPMPVRIWLATAILTAILIVLARPAGAADDPTRVMKTVGGIIQVEEKDPGRRLLFNRKPITYMDGTKNIELSNDIIILQDKYSLKGNDVVMLYSACSGSSCNYSSVYFVTVSPAGVATVAGVIAAGEGGLAKADVKVMGDTLEISSSTFISPRKRRTSRWVLSDGKLGRR